jgi:hypothetical protein
MAHSRSGRPSFRQPSIDESKVTIESVGFPVREPMLAQGQVDGIFGFAFSSVLNLKAQGVPADDISTILMAENGLDLYGNSILVNTDFAGRKPGCRQGLPQGARQGLCRRGRRSRSRCGGRHEAQRGADQGDRGRAARNGQRAEHQDALRHRERFRRHR